MDIPNAHHKAMDSHQLEEVMLCSSKITQQQQQQQQERKVRTHPEQALKCPRCASTNTKFCYYNNYSLSQPRYFCKGCRRYWTQGGSLRNVPVGGGCRKNKRSSSTSAKQAHESSLHIHATSSNPPLPALVPPALSYDPNDFTLAFASLQKQPSKQLGLQVDGHDQSVLFGHANAESITTAPINGFLDILRSGFVDTTASTSPLNSFYYGFGANCNGVEVGSVVGADGGVLSSDQTGFVGATGSTVTCQGSCKDTDEGETKVLMGLPWQVAAGNGSIAVESGRDYWTGVNSWHGLVNSSLM